MTFESNDGSFEVKEETISLGCVNTGLSMAL